MPVSVQESKPQQPATQARLASAAIGETEVAILTGGTDRHYAFGLAMALVNAGVALDVIGSDLIDGPEMHSTPGLRFLNLHGDITSGSRLAKLARIARFYLRLCRYSLTSRARVFHILWDNKLPLFDRTLLMAFYRLCGKKVAFTAHNVNTSQRDGHDSWRNRTSLRMQYALASRIFVHTGQMKTQLLRDFGLADEKVVVIPFGINNAVPQTSLTPEQARQRLGLGAQDKVILFFGALKSYKGLAYLVPAFSQLAASDSSFRLIIAGEPKKGYEETFAALSSALAQSPARAQILTRFEFIPDEDTELYHKAADVSVLPYTSIFQSGILFMAYSFGLPVVATDVGAFREDVLEGETGFICAPSDSNALAAALERYFQSNLYHALPQRRASIRDWARERHSWTKVAAITCNVYKALMQS